MRYVKVFKEYVGTIELNINKWLKENDDKEIVNILQTSDSSSVIVITIFYSDNNDKIKK